MKSLADQNMPSPNEILLPNAVFVSSVAEVKQRTPINKIANAMKKE